MDDSLTAFCKTCDESNRCLLTIQENSEVIIQENHHLKMKNVVLERVNGDLESELTFLNGNKSTEEHKLQNLKIELEAANSKVKTLEAKLEEEKLKLQILTKESNESKENHVETVIRPDQEQIDILTTQLLNLEEKREEDQEAIKGLLDDKVANNCVIMQLKNEKETLQNELTEVKEHLKEITNEVKNLNENIESIREEKLLLGTELQLLKASDTKPARGNSLFAEVEENRQKVAARHQLLKLKYVDLKKILGRSQAENNKLKLEIIRIKKEEGVDESAIYRDYDNLIETYKKRISEVENQVRDLQQQVCQSSKMESNGGDSQTQWVSILVENARKEAQTLQAELERRGTYYVVQGHLLFDSQKENRKLKTSIKKLESEIDELKMKLNAIATGKENVDDGISPPADDISMEFQKRKIVKFKEVVENHQNSLNEEIKQEVKVVE